MKHPFILLVAIAAITACTTQPVKAEQRNLTFDPTCYYSQLIINSNLYHFHCNTSKVGGLGRYNATTGEVAKGEYVDSRGFDYVNGLVFKATLEAIQLHYDTEGIEEDAYSWYKSVEEFGNRYHDKNHNGESLDDLNACKLYFGLYDITKVDGGLGGKYTNQATANNCIEAKTKALAGLKAHDTEHAISSETSKAFCGDDNTYKGGWFHKSTYKNQLWLDGQYMGPALLAMMVAEGKNISGSVEGDWAIIRKQFDMCWNRLWDDEKKLLYHAFSADPSSDQTKGWADREGSYATNPHYGVSKEFWGRAAGWYFFALVDILEQMDKAGKHDADYTELKRQLEAVADGLLKRQDKTTGCWCQLLQYGNGVTPDGC
ncbi:MAG: glycoside hydrolase family 88 protein, partial [Paludibacteraceae bacterium]|nr:glycoside hydrolase family 88 protein [Paludibacteraceae bacterium]